MWGAGSLNNNNNNNILNTTVPKPDLVLLYLMLPVLRNTTAFLEVSQAPSICPGKSYM